MSVYVQACQLAKVAALTQAEVVEQCDLLDTHGILTLTAGANASSLPRTFSSPRSSSSAARTPSSMRKTIAKQNVGPHIRLLMDTATARAALNDETLVGTVLNSL